MRFLIGLTGYSNSGKDTVAQMLMDEHGEKNTRIVRIAETLKQASVGLFGFDGERLNEQAYKEAPVEGMFDADGAPRTRRDCLIELGKMGRKLDPFFWVRRALGQVEWAWQEGATLVLVPDVRYLNEAASIRDAGGQVWRIHRTYPETERLRINDGDREVDLIHDDLAIANRNGELHELRNVVNEAWAVCKENGSRVGE